ncbi:hypothetical protein FF1_011186 [Malus domestica]
MQFLKDRPSQELKRMRCSRTRIRTWILLTYPGTYAMCLRTQTRVVRLVTRQEPWNKLKRSINRPKVQPDFATGSNINNLAPICNVPDPDDLYPSPQGNGSSRNQQAADDRDGAAGASSWSCVTSSNQC